MLDLAPAAASDDLRTTVDYGLVAARIVEVSTKERVNLLERLAGRLAQMLLARVPLRGGAGAGAQADAPDGGSPGHPRRRADPPR